MSATPVSQIASELLQAKRNKSLIATPSSRFPGFTLDEGYVVLRSLDQALTEEGFIRVGRKIGFTNPATWKEFNLDTPIWAHTYDRTVMIAEQGKVSLSIDHLTAPRIEPEVVLHVGEPLLATRDELALIRSIEAISIGFEIVDCHYPDWKFSAADAVADFGVHGLLVVGPSLKLDNHDRALIAGQLKSFQLELCKDGVVLEKGQGKNALGSPLLAMKYLHEVLSGQNWAAPISAGETITTGTLTPLPAIHQGETWSVGLKGIDLPPVTMEISQ